MKTIKVEIPNVDNLKAVGLAIQLNAELESIGINLIQNEGYVYDEFDVQIKSKVSEIIEKYIAYRELNIHII